MLGTSYFFERAVAISLSGLYPGAALATVITVLMKAPETL